MKNIFRYVLFALLTCTSSAAAASTATNSNEGLLISIFIGFLFLIIFFQLVPAALMLVGMFKGFFRNEVADFE